MRTTKMLRSLVLLAISGGLIYGGGRLYYHLTGGFSVDNIFYDIPADPRWEMTPLSQSVQEKTDAILAQPFTYLGKGCQSYVFLSEDGNYVIKFFKYQRIRPQEWLKSFSFIPYLEEYRLAKIQKKQNKLDNVLTSWKHAYESLQEETGVIFVHLNKKKKWDRSLIIFDKMGFQHEVDLNQTEFMVQKKAEMLCPTLDLLMQKGEEERAKLILSNLLTMLLSEYSRGFADNDHALMQNTGVIDGKAVHIDVGQFVWNPAVREPEVFQQEIVNKTYKFKKWLQEAHPALAAHLQQELASVIGDRYGSMQPIFYTADMARIPNL